MASNIFITYIVPCYNVEKYLPRCLESLAKQSVADGSGIEYVLVNDGSTDGTQDVLERFTATDNRAILINQKNQGVSAARNTGIRNAHGEYVYFLDGDDFLTDDASQIIFDASEKRADIIITNAYSVREGDWEKRKRKNNQAGLDPGTYEVKDYVEKASRLPISFKAYRKSLLDNHLIFYDADLKVGEVYTFFIHALVYSESVAVTDKRILNYVVRGGSVMRTFNVERDRTIISTMKRIDNYAKMQMPELLELSSYKLSIYDIVNAFSIVSYLRKSPYTQEIGNFLRDLCKEPIYKSLLKYFAFKEVGINLRTGIALSLYFLPMSIAYRLLRMLLIIRHRL